MRYVKTTRLAREKRSVTDTNTENIDAGDDENEAGGAKAAGALDKEKTGKALLRRRVIKKAALESRLSDGGMGRLSRKRADFCYQSALHR